MAWWFNGNIVFYLVTYVISFSLSKLPQLIIRGSVNFMVTYGNVGSFFQPHCQTCLNYDGETFFWSCRSWSNHVSLKLHDDRMILRLLYVYFVKVLPNSIRAALGGGGGTAASGLPQQQGQQQQRPNQISQSLKDSAPILTQQLLDYQPPTQQQQQQQQQQQMYNQNRVSECP